ncbi:MAG: hypothetical protein ACRC6M_13235, partial [Microcystaceae cyanobacterium]
MTIRDDQSDRLRILASGYAPFSVGITYDRSEVEKSGYFIFILNPEVAKTIREIQAQQKAINIYFPRYLDRLIIHDLIHLSGLVFVSYDERNNVYLASSSISLDGDIIQQISKQCLKNDDDKSDDKSDDYKSIVEAHFWLVKQTTNTFSEKIKNRAELFNSLLSSFSLLTSIGVSSSDASQVKSLIFLLTIIGLIILIKRIQHLDILFYFKNLILSFQSQLKAFATMPSTLTRGLSLLPQELEVYNQVFHSYKEKLKKVNPQIILNEIRLEINQPELSQVIFIIGLIVPNTATDQGVKNGLMLFIPFLIYLILGVKKWIKYQRFWVQFKQQLDQFPFYLKLSSFLTKFDVTIFLLEMAIAAFLMGSLIGTNLINNLRNINNIWLDNLNREYILLLIVGL